MKKTMEKIFEKFPAYKNFSDSHWSAVFVGVVALLVFLTYGTQTWLAITLIVFLAACMWLHAYMSDLRGQLIELYKEEVSLYKELIEELEDEEEGK